MFPAVQNSRYFFSAAVGPTPTPVFEAYNEHAKMMHFHGDVNWIAGVEKLQKTRELISHHIGAESPLEVAITYNTSHNMNIIADLFKQKGVKKILTCEEEFPSSTIPFLHRGFTVEFCPAHEIANRISNQFDAVLVSHIQYGTGYRLDLKKLGQMAKDSNCLFVVNATQSFGAFPIDVQQCHIDALTASGHKWLCAGYGSSILYLRSKFSENTTASLVGWLSPVNFEKMDNKNSQIRNDASKYETGVPSFATLAGVHAAIQLVEDTGIHRIANRILQLSHYFVEQLHKKSISISSHRIDSTSIEDSINSGTVTLSIREPDEFVEKLKAEKIYVSQRSGLIRVAIHYFNNQDDVDCLIERL